MFPAVLVAIALGSTIAAIVGLRGFERDQYAPVAFDGLQVLKGALQDLRATEALSRSIRTLIIFLILYIVWCGFLRGVAEVRERRTARVRLAFYAQGKWVLVETSGAQLPLLETAPGS